MTGNTPKFTELTDTLVAQALEQSRPQERLEWLAQRLALTVHALLPLAAQHFQLDLVNMDELRALEPDFTLVPFADCQRRGCLAGRHGAADGSLIVALTDPTDTRLRQWLEVRLRGQPGLVRMVLASAGDLQARLAIAEQSMRAMDTVRLDRIEPGVEGDAVLAISMSNIDATTSPLVRLVDSTLLDALRAGASDIHLETQTGGLSIKYRLDGVLVTIRQLDGVELANQAISRIKVVSELDIAERRVPQDGRFRVVADGREIDFRVSIMPNLFGEDAVLRVLDRKHLTGEFETLRLDTLGFVPQVLEFIRGIAQMPYGLLLVTGPTGSGKTTTLYATISEINTGLDKIVTIEDPIEYQLAGVLQIPVNEKKGLGFARGLRSILRHDPDKIMVGEIRDRETAEMAIQAALTGHNVYSTLHANNSFDVFSRLQYMGVDPYSLTSALNGIWAQRLMRTNCPHCSEPYTPSAAELAELALAPADLDGVRLARGRGCGDCRGTGYKGRRAIAEVMSMTDPLREMIAARHSVRDIKAEAQRDGTRFLRAVALDMVRRGETTLEEVLRVTLAA